jgi:hypothetical protein
VQCATVMAMCWRCAAVEEWGCVALLEGSRICSSGLQEVLVCVVFVMFESLFVA